MNDFTSQPARLTGTGARRTLRKRLSLGAAACACALALGACGGSDDTEDPTSVVPAVPTEAIPQATDAPMPTQVLAGDPVWSTSVEAGTNRPTGPVEDSFNASDPVIYAAIPVAAAPAGAMLTASWTYNDTPVQGMDATIQLPEVRFEAIWAEFHLEVRDAGDWPDGEYRIIVREGDQVVSDGVIEVVNAE